MLVYRIQKSSAAPSKLGDFLTKEELLKRNITKTWFVVGDKVKFKKPRRNPTYGTITRIEENPALVRWSRSDMVPLNITVAVDKVDLKSKIKYGTEFIDTNVKKLLFVSKE